MTVFKQKTELREPLIIHFLVIPRLDRGIHVFDFMDSRFRGNDRERLYGELLEVPFKYSCATVNKLASLGGKGFQPYPTTIHFNSRSDQPGLPHFQGQIGSGRLRRFTLNQPALAFARRRRDEANQV